MPGDIPLPRQRIFISFSILPLLLHRILYFYEMPQVLLPDAASFDVEIQIFAEV